MDFINWWFTEHYIWSTILTPLLTFIWCCFKELTGRAIVALMWLTLLYIIGGWKR